MKKNLFHVLVIGVVAASALLAMGCATTGAGRPLSSSDVAEVKALVNQFTDAMSRKDLDGAMQCFWNDPQLVVVLYGNTVRGYDAVKGGIAQMFAQNETVKLTVNEISYVGMGDMVMAVGTATYDLKPVNGDSTQLVERWTDLEKKVDGRWVYVMDHATIVPK